MSARPDHDPKAEPQPLEPADPDSPAPDQGGPGSASEATTAPDPAASTGHPDHTTGPDHNTGHGRTVNRRGLLGGLGIGLGSLAVGAGGATLARRHQDHDAQQSVAPQAYAFRGDHQAGITTPAQDRLHFAAFDMSSSATRQDLIELLQDWTVAAEAMTQGRPVGDGAGGNMDRPPDDTGEAVGLPPSGLTITFGFGPTLFRTEDGKDRFGIAARQPAALKRLPKFVADALDPDRSDGDLCIQACAEDPQVAVHAIRNLSRIAFGRAAIRWSQLGFGRTSSTSTTQETPRNLFGLKDGTDNIKAEHATEVNDNVWIASSAATGNQAWLAGGTYLVARRINMRIEVWDRQSLGEQQRVVGRTKDAGAPLSGGQEFTPPDFDVKGPDGQPAIDPNSHVRLAHPTFNGGVQMLRRGYNFVDGNDSTGHLDAGLFFLAFVNDPNTHYIPMQKRMAQHDLLQEYLQHTGSGLWAIPPGAQQGKYIGQGLFE